MTKITENIQIETIECFKPFLKKTLIAARKTPRGLALCFEPETADSKTGPAAILELRTDPESQVSSISFVAGEWVEAESAVQGADKPDNDSQKGVRDSEHLDRLMTETLGGPGRARFDD